MMREKGYTVGILDADITGPLHPENVWDPCESKGDRRRHPAMYREG